MKMTDFVKHVKYVGLVYQIKADNWLLVMDYIVFDWYILNIPSDDYIVHGCFKS